MAVRRFVVPVFLAVAWATAAFQLYVRGAVFDAAVYAVVAPLLFALLSVQRRLTGRGNRAWLSEVRVFALYILLFNVPGTLALHNAGIQFDRILHAAVGFLSLPLATLILIPLRVSRPIRLAFIICFLGLFLFEFNQWFWDQAVGTRLYYDVRQHINVDFWEDIAFGIAGLLLALPWSRHRLVRYRAMGSGRSLT